MKLLRIIWRFVFFVFYTISIVIETSFRRVFLNADLREAMHIRRRWARRLMKGVGVRIQVEGVAPVEACLVVCNHRSYLDPILLLSQIEAFPVAKAELESWPLLGKGAQQAGILYLRRENMGSRAAILKDISKAISDGFSVMLFPEGTTSALPCGLLPFKRGAFRAAAQEGFPVTPVALCFVETADFWVGSDTFLQHAFRRFKQKTIEVKIVFGPLLHDADAVVLQEKSWHWIESQLIANPPK